MFANEILVAKVKYLEAELEQSRDVDRLPAYLDFSVLDERSVEDLDIRRRVKHAYTFDVTFQVAHYFVSYRLFVTFIDMAPDDSARDFLRS